MELILRRPVITGKTGNHLCRWTGEGCNLSLIHIFGTDVNDIEVSFNGTSAKEIRLVDESTIEAVTPRNWVSGNVVITIRGYATVSYTHLSRKILLLIYIIR